MVRAALWIAMTCFFEVSAGLDYHLANVGAPRCELPFAVAANQQRRRAESLIVSVRLGVDITNSSRSPKVIGKVAVAQEWIYRKDGKDGLKLIRTSGAPEVFHTRDKAGYLDIVNETLWPNETKYVTVDYALRVGAHDIQRPSGKKELTVSFLITNLEHNGHISNYWTEPVSIDLPETCPVNDLN